LPGPAAEGEHQLVVAADQVVLRHRAEALAERRWPGGGEVEVVVAELAQRRRARLARREERLGGRERGGRLVPRAGGTEWAAAGAGGGRDGTVRAAGTAGAGAGAGGGASRRR
jgi:hypothetical protein